MHGSHGIFFSFYKTENKTKSAHTRQTHDKHPFIQIKKTSIFAHDVVLQVNNNNFYLNRVHFARATYFYRLLLMVCMCCNVCLC